ncbi:PKD domain-containing protein [Salinisphaera aquimarina]|uniref:PKD domain-containing protein n=1 Tax=Salinisphaera aquimarina TaxID=2094031 RepID=A0ABV7EKX5_9GAMM
MTRSNRFFRTVFPVLLLFMLAGCGGGSGGSDSNSGSNAGGDSNNGGSSQMLRANAGNDRDVVTGTTVTLDGSQSSTTGDGQLSYDWRLVSKPSGSDAVLTRAQAATPSFTADADGAYVAQLVLGSGAQESPADQVTITATRGNTRPSADAGADQNVKTGALVTLDGGASADADGNTLTYRWSVTSRPAASKAPLSNSTTRTPSFTAGVAGRYVVSLVVSDGTVSSRADSVVVIASQGNSVPVAEAGANQEIATGATVQLDGRASSDADGDTLSYSWRIVSQPQGSAAGLANPNSARPSLTTDALGDYVIELVASDGQASSVADRLVVSAGPVLALFLYDNEQQAIIRAPNQVTTAADVEEGTGDRTIVNVPLSRFVFRAVGRDYTIQDVSTEIIATPSGRTLDPNFQNFDNGVIPMGTTVEFTTNASSVTGSGIYDFVFTFTIVETGEKYRFAYRLTVN